MTDEEILFRVIKKAQENNYKPSNLELKFISNDSDYPFFNNKINDYEGTCHINKIIFSHDFAKAFWGEEKNYISSVLIIVNENTKQERLKIIKKREFLKIFGKNAYVAFVENSHFQIALKHTEEQIQKCFKQELCFRESRVPETGWQFHLQQMILEKEPLKYLESFL